MHGEEWLSTSLKCHPINTTHCPFSTYHPTQSPLKMAQSFPSLLLVCLLTFSCSSLLALGIRDRGDECQLDRINALEPSSRVKSEAGVTEYWDPNEDQFRCSGVAFMRRSIEPNGLLLPYFRSAPELFYVIKGKGIRGLSTPGCPETYQSVSRGQSESRGLQDQHQKVWRIRQGDVFVGPAGIVEWVFNDGEEELVLVNLLDTANENNQLDQSVPRGFFLAGNPQQEFEEEQGERGQEDAKNILAGFNPEILEEVFQLPREIIDKIRSKDDDRKGQIVRAEQLRVIRPPTAREDEQWEERQRGGEEGRSSRRGDQEQEDERRRHEGGRGREGRRGERDLLAAFNGVEETSCYAKMRENIDDPSEADVFVPQAGRLTTLNSFKLPFLRNVRLSAEKGVLYRNALMVPNWNLNAHSLIYAIKGSARVQIVNERGHDVFRGELRENQLVVAPQNFVLMKQAGDEGFEWISFKTNDNAIAQTVAGRTSFLRALPLDVIMSAYQVSREEADKLKNEREETVLFAPGSRSRGGEDESERRSRSGDDDESERRAMA